jgi:hypothetical protein
MPRGFDGIAFFVMARPAALGALLATSDMSIAISSSGMGTEGGGGGGACARLVSDCGTTAMTSPPSVTVGRGGTTAVARDASNASGASAMSDSETFVQSSPERFCTMPHACSVAPCLSSTRRYDGRQIGVAAM